jgi:hypothetical protein
VNRVVSEVGAEVPFTTVDDLIERLRDRPSLRAARSAMDAGRFRFTFEAVADRLLGVLLGTARRTAA